MADVRDTYYLDFKETGLDETNQKLGKVEGRTEDVGKAATTSASSFAKIKTALSAAVIVAGLTRMAKRLFPRLDTETVTPCTCITPVPFLPPYLSMPLPLRKPRIHRDRPACGS